MSHDKVGAFTITGLSLLIVLGAARQAMAQDASPHYAKMAPVAAYLMPDRAAEIALARSASPKSISHCQRSGVRFTYARLNLRE